MPVVVTDTVVIPDDNLEVSFSRSGGSGGQNVNKVSSKVLLRFHLERCAVLTPGAKSRLRAACPSRRTGQTRRRARWPGSRRRRQT